MGSYLLNSGAFLGVVGEKGEDKIFELSAEILAANFGKVSVILTSDEQVVEVLLCTRLFERENSLHDNEEDNSEGE